MITTKVPLYLLLFIGLTSLILFACTPKKETITNNSNEQNLKNEVAVLLKDKASPEQLEKQFSKYDLKNKGRSSKTEYLFTYTFNPDKISVSKLLQELIANDAVLKVNSIKNSSEVEVQSGTSGQGKKVKINPGG